MADMALLERALINADKAGDVEAAKMLAAEISRQRSATQPTAVAPDPTEGMSFGEKALAGAGKALTDIYRGGKQLLGVGDQKALQAEIDESKRLDAPLMRTGAGMAGNIGAKMAIAIPTAAIPGANTIAGSGLIGAGIEALTPVPTGDSRANNVALGAAGGAVGAGIAKILGRTINPIQSRLPPELQTLADKAVAEKIPLDAADLTGSRPLKVIRSVMESLPLTADKQAAINEAKRAAFNRAVLSNVGETADKATPDVLNAARSRIGDVFNDVSARNNVNLGDDFLEAIAKVDSAVTPFSNAQIKGSMHSPGLIDKALDLAGKGTISGQEYQKVRTVLGKSSADAFNSGNSELGGALKAIRNSLDEAATNSISGADQDAWRQARQQWQNLKVLEKAAAPNSADAVAGNVSPAKLAQALMSVDKNGMIYGTRGDNMGDLARIGQAFVKEQIPNSGTAERSLWTKILTGNPIESVWQTGIGGVSAPVQALINSKAGQSYLANGLLPMNARTQMLADILRQGAVGAGAALPSALLE